MYKPNSSRDYSSSSRDSRGGGGGYSSSRGGGGGYGSSSRGGGSSSHSSSSSSSSNRVGRGNVSGGSSGSSFRSSGRDNGFSNPTGGSGSSGAPRNRDQQDITLNKPIWNPSHMKDFEKKFYNEENNLTSRNPQVLNDFLRTNNVSVAGAEFIKPILEFKDADLPHNFIDRLYEKSFKKPTPIQSMCWPTLLSGNDLVGVAQTGSGKTLGFIIPILIHIQNNKRYMQEISRSRDETPGPVALVLAPTRELAIQIQQVAEEFERSSGIRNICIYGGASKGGQASQIRRGAEIYIATPGRLLDFLKEGTISLNKCTYLVLDEADRMLDMGFEPQIRKIIEQIRPDRQTAMFSATWPKEVRKLAEDFITQYIHITIGSSELTANPKITQNVEVIEESMKEGRLREILSDIMRARDAKTIIFAETKRKVDYYSKLIREIGYHCLSIHGDKKQQEREWVLQEFRKKSKSILCATDVAARGINIEDIKYVINIDYPMATEDYIHRIGRTARSSNTGTAYTFITRENSRHVPQLINVLKDANQFVSEQLQSLVARGGFRNGGARGGFQRGGYGNSAPGGFGNRPGSNYGGSSGSEYRKREASSDVNGDIKRKRWDEPHSGGSHNHMNGNGINNRGPSSYNNNRPSNGHSNGTNGHHHHSTYGPPKPTTNGHHQAPPLPPPPSSLPPPPPPSSSSSSSNGHHTSSAPQGQPPVSAASYGYPSDYSQMYNNSNIAYYQAIAAAAASNGQSWQQAAPVGYPPVPPVKAP